MQADPQLLSSMVKQARQAAGDVPVSVKMRIHSDIQRTVDHARQLEAAGVSWITVHARQLHQRNSEPPNFDAFRTIRSSVSLPLIANGNVFTMQEAETVATETGANGIMAARGLLRNPALFSGVDCTPRPLIREFVERSLGYGTSCFIFHHHLSFMLEAQLDSSTRKLFNTMTNVSGILDFLKSNNFL